MKTRYIYILLLAICGATTSCLNNDYLEITPLDSQTEATAFKTSTNFETYAWGLYEVFNNNNTVMDQRDNYPYKSERYTDNFFFGYSGYYNKFTFQTMTVPTTGGNYVFDYVRQVNIMLDNIETSQMTQVDKDHWRSVGYFFRSYWYLDLMFRFGDVQWIESTIDIGDEEVVYASRDSRDVVAAHILENLQWAESHIKEDGNGTNTVNTDIVRSLLSRFGLFEGTWRKYHGLSDSQTYLEESRRVSQLLVDKYNTIMDNYYDIYVSEELVGQPGIIFAAEFAHGFVTHNRCRLEGSSSQYYEMCKEAFDSYLCQDGNTIENSSTYDDSNMYSQFRDRDYRLYFTVCPPYEVSKDGGAQDRTWYHTDKEYQREYIDLLDEISPDAKRLPMCNWNDFVVYGVPHFRTDSRSQPYNATQGGLYVWKHYTKERDQDFSGGYQSTDACIFRVGEMMMNLAEATYELDGTISQGLVDLTINKLRARGNVAPLDLAAMVSDNSDRRDSEISDILWEIRRERRIEFMGDNLRYYDIRRWKKAHYMNRQQLGCKITDEETPYTSGVTVNSEGYVEYFPDPVEMGRGWLDLMYLQPIPTQELELNENIQQNPGWDTYSPS